VKSYYNPNLWQANSRGTSGELTPKSPLTTVLVDPKEEPTEMSVSPLPPDISEISKTELPSKEPVSEPKSEPAVLPEILVEASAPKVPDSATTDNLPPGVLYKVKATYKYQAEDMDELQFEVGEIIDVIEYEDPEEQEEGWLMGVKDSTGQKGLFPANFTKPI